MRLRLLLAAVCALLGLIGQAAPGHAQSDGSVYIQRYEGGRNPLDWLLGRKRSQSGTAAVIHVDPHRNAPRSYKPRRRNAPAPALARPSVPTAPVVTPETAPHNPDIAAPATAEAPLVPSPPAMTPVNIAVIGDSLSIFLAQGLQELYADRPAVTFTRRNRESSGLVRDDYYDWPKNLKELLATTPNLDAIVVMIGSNDRQQLRDEAGVHEPRSERWTELYIRRIDALTAIARERKLPLIWVGLPTMRADRYRADMLAFNDLYRQRAAAAGVAFIDVWEAFAGEDGDYVVSGPDIGGEMVRLRTADGVHFTKAGARKLAFFADKEIQKIVAGRQATSAAPMAASLDPGLPPALMAPAPTAFPEGPNLPQPEPLTADQLAPPPRPLQGPVLVLTAPPSSPGGQLATVKSLPPRKDMQSIVMDGQIPAAKPGRADDFTLPAR